MVQVKYTNCTSAVVDGYERTDWLEVKSDVKQRCNMSGFLSVLVIDWVMRSTGEHAKIWRSGQLSKNTKIRIFKSSVTAVVLYECETYRMTKRDEVKLDKFIYKYLRRLVKIYWPIRVTNEEARRRARTCTISE